MLHLYVASQIRINQAKDAVATKFHERADEGFVSAETIGLAVAGLVIVGFLFVAFKDQLVGSDGKTGWVSDIFAKIKGDTGTDTP